MPFDPHRHHRRSVRLREHSYADGVYFVTACTYRRQRLFGEVASGAMVLSPLGVIARDEWLRTAEVRTTIALDASVVMPDHVHLLFGILPRDGNAPDTATMPPVGATRRVAPTEHRAPGPPRGSVSAIIGRYKSLVTKRIRALDPTVHVWQRSFHDRIVRTDREANTLRRYIAENPARWDPDADRADGHRA